MAATTVTKERLEAILTKRLGLKDAVFHLEKAGDRLVGNIISPSFKGKRDLQRQGMIWDALESEFGSESVQRIGMLLAFTPDEWDLGEDEKPVAKKAKKVS